MALAKKKSVCRPKKRTHDKARGILQVASPPREDFTYCGTVSTNIMIFCFYVGSAGANVRDSKEELAAGSSKSSEVCKLSTRN